jgi:hypothetical protein
MVADGEAVSDEEEGFKDGGEDEDGAATEREESVECWVLDHQEKKLVGAMFVGSEGSGFDGAKQAMQGTRVVLYKVSSAQICCQTIRRCWWIVRKSEGFCKESLVRV